MAGGTGAVGTEAGGTGAWGAGGGISLAVESCVFVIRPSSALVGSLSVGSSVQFVVVQTPPRIPRVDAAGVASPGTPPPQVPRVVAYRGAMQDVGVIAVLGVGVLDGPHERAVFGDDVGMTRGDGCFEVTRLVVDADGAKQVDHLDAHIARMHRSASALELSFDEAAWRSLLDEVVAAWSLPGEASLRWILTRGRESVSGEASGVVTVIPIDDATLRQRAGVTVVSLASGRAWDAFVDAPWLLGGAKTLSYAVNMSAGREARRRGVDEALWVTTEGFALEAPRSALVWRVGDRLVTTRTDRTGILASITQAMIFAGAAVDGVETSFELIRVADLPRVDGAWLVSSARLVAPIRSVDGAPLRDDQRWTERLRRWSSREI